MQRAITTFFRNRAKKLGAHEFLYGRAKAFGFKGWYYKVICI